MHGDLHGCGAPLGSKNGNYKHGRYTAEVAATKAVLVKHFPCSLSECIKCVLDCRSIVAFRSLQKANLDQLFYPLPRLYRIRHFDNVVGHRRIFLRFHLFLPSLLGFAFSPSPTSLRMTLDRPGKRPDSRRPWTL
jgi:hypothetical protein